MAKRQRRGAEEWREILEELDRSGETIVAFCQRRDLSPWSLKDWRRRFGHGRRRAGRPSNAGAFVPVVPRPAATVRVDTSCGLRIEVPLDFDPRKLGILIRSLAGPQ